MLEVKKGTSDAGEIDPRDSFRDALEDLVQLCDTLAPLCDDSVTRLAEVSKLALTNEHQFEFLMRLTALAQPNKKK